jgi:formylmethanofuran dehydrogenase subunit E
VDDNYTSSESNWNGNISSFFSFYIHRLYLNWLAVRVRLKTRIMDKKIKDISKLSKNDYGRLEREREREKEREQKIEGERKKERTFRHLCVTFQSI